MKAVNPFDWLGNGVGAEDDGNAFEQNKEMEEAAIRALREEARLFYEVFCTGRGPELLEKLRFMTIEQDLMVTRFVIGNAEREVPVNPAEWAYHRNGQNSVVRYIETMCREAIRLETEESPNV